MKISEECFNDIVERVKANIEEGLFVNDGRGDLLDDVSKTVTGDTVMGNIKKGVAKALTPKKEKKVKSFKASEDFDSFKEISYNVRNIAEITEAIINEISDKKHRELIDELQDGINTAEEIKGMTPTADSKKKIEDIIVAQKHRLAVSQNKRENKVTNRAKEDEFRKKEGN